MITACCIWALSQSETDILRQVHDIGFQFIDIQPMHQRTMESRLLAQELGLRVSCVGASFGLPEGAALDHSDSSKRELAINHIHSAIAHAAEIGAEIAYVIPGADARPAALARYQDSIARLAAAGADLGIKLAVEHFTGTALPTAAETLEFIRQADQENLYLLYDSGHIQMSGEDPATVIANAGETLGYVHFDDNDGVSDLHWSLLDGVMTEESVAATFQALDEAGYGGAVSLELSPQLPAVRRALEKSRDVLLRAQFA